MGYTLAVFRARTQTLLFANILKSYNIPILIVETPRSLNISCGLSVKFDTKLKSDAQQIIFRRRFDSFAGFYDF